MKLNEIMTRDVATCRASDSLALAAQKMKANDCGILPVCDENQRVLGVVTDRDLATRGLSRGANTSDVKVGECMSSHVISATSDMDVHDAANLMAQNQIRRLVVLDGERLAGMVSIGDMATEQIHINEAGDALSGISEPTHRGGH